MRRCTAVSRAAAHCIYAMNMSSWMGRVHQNQFRWRPEVNQVLNLLSWPQLCIKHSKTRAVLLYIYLHGSWFKGRWHCL